MATKVCMLVTAHSFLDARIFKKEAKSLMKNGYKVTMIVPRLKGNLFDVDGKILPNPFKVFKHEGIKIITYDFFDYTKQLNLMNKNINSSHHQGFMDNLTRLGIDEEADIYHAHEFASLYSGIGIKRTLEKSNGKKVKLIYDSHEIDPDPYNPNRKDHEKLMRPMLVKMLKEVDYVITVSNSMKSWYLNFDPQLPIEVVYNSPPLSTSFSPKDYNSDRFIIVHEGAITQTKGNFKKLTRILEICNQNSDKFHFKIIGGIHGTKYKLTIPPNLKNKIEVTGWVDYFAIPEMMKDADIGWIDFDQLHLSLNRQYALPNKFFSYLNNGVPVLVNQCPEMENIVKKYNCGVVIEKEHATAEDYANAILSLYNNKNQLREMSNNARNFMIANSWEEMEKRLLTIYKKLQNQ